MRTSTPLLGHLAAFFTIFVWGVTFINSKMLLESFSPIEITFYRLLISLLVLIALSPPRPGRSKLNHAWTLEWVQKWLSSEWRYIVAGLCGVTGYFTLQNLALSYTLAANVSVLVSVAPLLVALVSRAILHEKLKAYFFLGFSLAIAGIILISFNGTFALKLNPLGDLLSILAALVWAFYSVLIKQISARQESMFTVTRKVFTYGVIFTLPLLPLFGFQAGFERLLVLPNLMNLLFLGGVASALCFVTWNVAVGILGPVKTSVYIYLVPVITIVASALILNETITLVAGIGMALILSGMVISERGRGNDASHS